MIYYLGTPGKILASTDSINGEIPNSQKQYVAAQNGNDVTLTIDVNIQSIAEKYLAQAISDNYADSGNVIIMNPQNGDILPKATKPYYNLNDPSSYVATGYTKEEWESFESAERTNKLQNLWKNKRKNA